MMKKRWWNIFRKGTSLNKRSFADTLRDYGYSSDKPVYVNTENQAMKLATVFRCTAILSGSIASLPLEVKRKKDGYFVYDEGSSLNYVLNKVANPRMSSYQLIANAVVRMVNSGNAFILPIYDEYNIDLRQLVLLSPNTVSFDVNQNIYIVNDTINNIIGTYEADEIIHLKNLSLDGGYSGVSTIRYAATTMSVAASADERSLNSFQPGSTYKGFVSGDDEQGISGFGMAQDEQLEDVTKRIKKEINSGENIFYVPGKMKFNTLSMSPADVQLLETKKFSVLDICRFYGVHPDKAFAGQSQNYKASEMSQVAYLTDTLQPLLRQIESELFAKLIPRSLADKYRIEFDLESFFKTDLKSMSSYMEKQIQYGVSTVNEWRKKQGTEPIEGGDVAMMSCNVAPINSSKIRGEK